jgi:ABC-type uncharacterized transport system involved in gliding motility auxiliary subunit
MTLTGRDLIVRNYGSHVVTRNLRKITTRFYLPRSVEPAVVNDASARDADRPLVTTLAMTTADGWADADPGQNPLRFDEDTDRPGPITVAVAVEKGPITGIEVELRPTRMVVIGDSDFLSNGALKSGVGGNLDFMMNSVNWLLEREELMAIRPKVPGELRLEMDAQETRAAVMIVVLAIPGAVALIGAAVWLRRKV